MRARGLAIGLQPAIDRLDVANSLFCANPNRKAHQGTEDSSKNCTKTKGKQGSRGENDLNCRETARQSTLIRKSLPFAGIRNACEALFEIGK
jgi:hypothetical protein